MWFFSIYNNIRTINYNNKKITCYFLYTNIFEIILYIYNIKFWKYY